MRPAIFVSNEFLLNRLELNNPPSQAYNIWFPLKVPLTWVFHESLFFEMTG
jgi:hypothetical protein